MLRNMSSMYSASDYGKKEEALHRLFRIQLDDARNYFSTIIKPRLDRSYKLYIAYAGDRQTQIKTWQANIFVPYTLAVVETMLPRILDARPDFTVLGRNQDDQLKAEKQQQLGDYFWERAKMDATTEDFVRSALIYGTGFLQVSWKKDVRKLKFLQTKDVTDNKKYKWVEEERTFYDAPYCEWVDNYSLWYDWHNSARASKQYWFKRMVLSEAEIRRRYPMADEKRLLMALASPGGDLVDYASIRQQVRTTHDKVFKGADTSTIWGSSTSVFGSDRYGSTDDTMKMYECFEWIRPFDDSYSVMVGASYVPIFKKAAMPIPYDFKEAPFIETTYLKIPGEFEGYGFPLILENQQTMLNMVKNQRLDAATLSIHKMWIVNPLANVSKDELVTRPFGIIYSIDPNGVKEIQFSDIKPSAYKEEEMLKNDMQYASGVDDFSMGTGGSLNGGGATAVRHLRESTLERVRLFVNHLGDAYSDVLRYWIDMQRQLFTKTMTIRVIGADGKEMFPLIEKDDLCGFFDYKASVLPSIAGQQDVKKKQDMDLFQLLVNIPPEVSGIDVRKLISRTIQSWGWSLDSISKPQDQMGGQAPGGMPGAPEGTDPAALMAMMGQGGGMPPPGMDPNAMGGMPQGAPAAPNISTKTIPAGVLSNALAMLRDPESQGSPFQQLGTPVNLLNAGSPPTPRGVSARPGPTSNPRGLNRTGKVNTTVNTNKKTSTESNLVNRAANIN